MAKFRVKATLTLDYDTDEHPWIRDGKHALMEYINTEYLGTDHFEITTEEIK